MQSHLARRYAVFMMGLFCISMAIGFITKASLGTSPITSIPYSLSLVFPHPPVHPHGQVDHRPHGQDQHPVGGRHLVPLRISGRFLDVGLLRLRSFRIPAPSRIGPGRDRHPGIRSLLPDPRRRGHGPRGRVRIRPHHACEEELRQGAHDLGFHHGDHRRRHRHRRSRHPRRSQRGHDSLLPSHGTAGQEVHGGPGSVLIETYPGQEP